MAATLQGATGLIYLPGRTSTRLENGVVEVSRTYACRTADAASLRDLFDVGQKMPGEPSVTIKFNFTETTREDGFTEFSVTGSGPDPSQPSSGQSGIKIQETRLVTNFPSGLVRVERTYVCPTADEARFRPVLAEGAILPFDDGTPSIDGLYIFPTPNEVRRDDGYTEFRVTAYGRTGTSSDVEISSTRDVIDETVVTINSITNVQTSVTSPKTCIKESYTYRRVIARGESIAGVLSAPSIVAKVYFLDGTFIVNNIQTSGNTTTTNIVALYLAQFTSSNFGNWTELVYNYEIDASINITTRIGS